MAAKIKIVTKAVSMTAMLNDSKTSAALLEALPVKSTAERWGDEVYFSVPLEMPAENAQAKVPSGTVAYWPDGPSVCLFFGQTPYSPVNPLGTLDGDAKEFAKVKDGEAVSLERCEE